MTANEARTKNNAFHDRCDIFMGLSIGTYQHCRAIDPIMLATPGARSPHPGIGLTIGCALFPHGRKRGKSWRVCTNMPR